MRSPLLSGCALAVFSLVLAPKLVHAQAYDRLAPRQLPSAPAPDALKAPGREAPPLPQSAAVVVPALKGLVFVPGVQAVRATGLPAGTAGVLHAGLPLLDDAAFGREMAARLGRPLSFADLNAIAQRVSQ
ncbi:hypothetical protein HLH32_12395, partial [Gluconacetobacter liquefaciens]